MRIIVFVSSMAGLALILAAPVFAATDKYKITPQEHAACDHDAEMLCYSAYPDENKMISCMEIKRSQLTAVCLSTFEAGLKRRHIGM